MQILKSIMIIAVLLLALPSSALDIKGYDFFGYNERGYDIAGYNFFGYNKNGINRQGCNVYAYKNDDKLDCRVDPFAEKAKQRPDFLAYQLRRSKELLVNISI